jgi:hypothetical protein
MLNPKFKLGERIIFQQKYRAKIIAIRIIPVNRYIYDIRLTKDYTGKLPEYYGINESSLSKAESKMNYYTSNGQKLGRRALTRGSMEYHRKSSKR